MHTQTLDTHQGGEIKQHLVLRFYFPTFIPSFYTENISSKINISPTKRNHPPSAPPSTPSSRFLFLFTWAAKVKSLHTIEPWVSRGTSDQWGGLFRGCFFLLFLWRGGCELREKIQSERSVWWIKILKFRHPRQVKTSCFFCLVYLCQTISYGYHLFSTNTSTWHTLVLHPKSLQKPVTLRPNNRGTYAAVARCHQTSRSLPRHSRLELHLFRFHWNDEICWLKKNKHVENWTVSPLPYHPNDCMMTLCACPFGMITSLPFRSYAVCRLENWVASRVSTQKNSHCLTLDSIQIQRSLGTWIQIQSMIYSRQFLGHLQNLLGRLTTFSDILSRILQLLVI